MRITIEALADDHVATIVAACGNWSELASYGPPYWRPRSAAELRRKMAATAGPQLSAEYNFVVAAEGALVGECSIHAIDWRNRTAQVGVCIWRPEHRRQGYGRAAVQDVIDWASGYLGLSRLEAWVVAGNDPSLRLFESFGFEREGTLRRRYLCAGRRYDMHLLAHLT